MSGGRRGGVLATALLFVVALTAPATATATIRSESDPTERYRPPVDAPILDPFRPPEHDWLPGNRGLEYDTRPGQFVRAVGSGVVTFAGQVGGQLHVTVQHADGLRSSYSFVATIRVRVGDRVRGGDLLAIAATNFHLGVRRGDRYIDPESIFGQPVRGGTIRLVPADEPVGTPRTSPPAGFVEPTPSGRTASAPVQRGFEALRRHWGSRPSRG